VDDQSGARVRIPPGDSVADPRRLLADDPDEAHDPDGADDLDGRTGADRQGQWVALFRRVALVDCA
jgi:hypothetical protein